MPIVHSREEKVLFSKFAHLRREFCSPPPDLIQHQTVSHISSQINIYSKSKTDSGSSRSARFPPAYLAYFAHTPNCFPDFAECPAGCFPTTHPPFFVGDEPRWPARPALP